MTGVQTCALPILTSREDTLEDLLEQIVGEIQDEYDWEERPVERLRDGSLVVEGTFAAADLREAHKVPLPEGEFETVAGFMLEQLGSVPKGGEVVQLPGWRYTVVDVEKNRVSKVKIEKLPAADGSTAVSLASTTRGALGVEPPGSKKEAAGR